MLGADIGGRCGVSSAFGELVPTANAGGGVGVFSTIVASARRFRGSTCSAGARSMFGRDLRGCMDVAHFCNSIATRIALRNSINFDELARVLGSCHPDEIPQIGDSSLVLVLASPFIALRNLCKTRGTALAAATSRAS
jgi:hypothetical protein